MLPARLHDSWEICSITSFVFHFLPGFSSIHWLRVSNQLGLLFQTRSPWIDENPGKKWNTKEVIEQISHESWRRAGNMTRAGNLPYQEGALSIVFQFAAIQQKLLMNLLQDTATTMTPAQRAKLTAVRLKDRKSTRLNSSHGYISYAVFF